MNTDGLHQFAQTTQVALYDERCSLFSPVDCCAALEPYQVHPVPLHRAAGTACHAATEQKCLDGRVKPCTGVSTCF